MILHNHPHLKPAFLELEYIFLTIYSKNSTKHKPLKITKIKKVNMKQEMVQIPKEEYKKLKKKAEIADDIVLQLESSLRDAEAGRIKRVA